MSERFESVFDKVARLIRVLTDPDSAAEDRFTTAAALASVSADELRRLQLDGEWQFVVDALAGETPAAESAEDSAPEKWHVGREPHPLPPTPSLRLRFNLYEHDLRRLINQDFDETPLVSPAVPVAASFMERFEVAAHATPSVFRLEPGFIRLAAGSRLNHGVLLLGPLAQAQGPVLEAFWDAVLHGRVHRGVPPVLARIGGRGLSMTTGRLHWLNETMEWVQDFVERELLSFLGLEELKLRHAQIRTGIATRVRNAEITDPRLVALTELAGTVSYLRRLSYLDLLRSWQDGRGDAIAAVSAYERLNAQAELQFEVGLRAAFCHPSPEILEDLGGFARQSLRLSATVCSMDAQLQQRGLLTPTQG